MCLDVRILARRGMNLGFRIFGWVMVGPLLALLLSRWLYFDKHHALIAANMFARYLYLFAWPILPIAWVLEETALGVASSVVCAWHAILLWRDVRGLVIPRRKFAGKGSRLRVVAANLLMVNPKAGALMKVWAIKPTKQ